MNGHEENGAVGTAKVVTPLDLSENLSHISAKVAFLRVAIYASAMHDDPWSDKAAFGSELIFCDLEGQLDAISDKVRKLGVRESREGEKVPASLSPEPDGTELSREV